MDLIRPFAFPVISLILMAVVRGGHAQDFAPAPAPTSDGVAIDQGIAYALLLVALAITYLFH